MRIGINGSFWNQPNTGSGQYLTELLAALSRCAPENEYRVILPEQATVSTAEFAHTSFIVDGLADGLGRNAAKMIFEQVAFPRACRREKVAIAHVPYFASPLFPTIKTVVTIHDLIPLILPLYRGSARLRLYSQVVSAAARRASAVITDSDCSKRDIVERLHIPEEQIHVVYLGVNERFRPTEDTRSIKDKYQLPEHFVLYLGGYDQRKNVTVIIDAFARLRDLYDAGYRLVLAGRMPNRKTSLLPDPRQMVRDAGLPADAVLFVGEVAEADKPALYSIATVFAFASLYEGFGLPALEAMACGTPVVCSNASSLPEIVGDAGISCDPRQVEEWAEALHAVLSDSAQRIRMSERGLEQSRRFSWDRTARKTAEIYKQVARA